MKEKINKYKKEHNYTGNKHHYTGDSTRGGIGRLV